jgi:hypothetical protein
MPHRVLGRPYHRFCASGTISGANGTAVSFARTGGPGVTLADFGILTLAGTLDVSASSLWIRRP